MAESGGNPAGCTSNTLPSTDPGGVSDGACAAVCAATLLAAGEAGRLSSSAGCGMTFECVGTLVAPDGNGSATIGSFTALVLPEVVMLCPNSRPLKDRKQRREMTRLLIERDPGFEVVCFCWILNCCSGGGLPHHYSQSISIEYLIPPT